MLTKDTNGKLHLKHSHIYFAQIQGQMALGGRVWSDFIVYTQKAIHVERIPFDKEYWKELLPKLQEFYTLCIAPEIVCPCHPFGLKIRDL